MRGLEAGGWTGGLDVFLGFSCVCTTRCSHSAPTGIQPTAHKTFPVYCNCQRSKSDKTDLLLRRCRGRMWPRATRQRHEGLLSAKGTVQATW